MSGKYNEKQKQAIYRWRLKSPDNMKKHIATVSKSVRITIKKAKAMLGDKCVVEGCKIKPALLDFHHIAGDGATHRKEIGRETVIMARYIINHPNYKGIELRCPKHHGEADRLLGLRGPKSRLTDDQIQKIRLSKETCIVLAKKYGMCQSTISAIRLGKRCIRLPWPENK
jgi:hypothetical protein